MDYQQQLKEIGGNEWVAGDKHRIYFKAEIMMNAMGLEGQKGDASTHEQLAFSQRKFYYDCKAAQFVFEDRGGVSLKFTKDEIIVKFIKFVGSN